MAPCSMVAPPDIHGNSRGLDISFFQARGVLYMKKFYGLELPKKHFGTIKNKNYYVVGDAEFARPRNTLKIISDFFKLLNQ